MSIFHQYLLEYGYPMLFVVVLLESLGIPGPGQALLITAALLAAHGKLDISMVLTTAIVGTVLGGMIGYWIGRTAGPAIDTGAGACNIAITPSGKTAYVASGDSDTVTPISIATGRPGHPIKVGRGPAAVAVTPDGKTVYVANGLSGTVTPISTATNTAGPPIRVGGEPTALVITP